MVNDKIKDFEEAFRVIKIDEDKWIGAYPLRLPMPGARGVYGGHTVAQSLLVAMESAQDDFIPHSFHSYFIAAGVAEVPYTYKVMKLSDDEIFCKRHIRAIQNDRVRFTCMVSLVQRGYKVTDDVEDIKEIQIKPPVIQKIHRNPSKLRTTYHTDYIKNAYTKEFVDHRKVPEELNQEPSERWITLFSGIDQKHSFKDPNLNYVGLADLSDSGLLTTMARALHYPWNPTVNNGEFDKDKNALLLLKKSLNIVHLFHYNAMSLDHHIYFHTQNSTDFDVIKDWLCFTYQFKRVCNNRALVRGYLLAKNRKVIATVIQEGLTYIHSDIANKL